LSKKFQNAMQAIYSWWFGTLRSNWVWTKIFFQTRKIWKTL